MLAVLVKNVRHILKLVFFTSETPKK
jgi:hypothetical protein